MNKVLILTNNSGGLYSFRREMILSLTKHYEVVVSTCFDDNIPELTELGCRLIEASHLSRRSKNPLKDIGLLYSYLCLIRKEKPDIVLTYTIKPNVYGGVACRFTNTPYISNVTGVGTAIHNGGVLARFVESLYRIGLKRAQCVFFQNTENKHLFESLNIINGKCRLIPGSGVNTQMHFYEAYPAEATDIHFLFVGRVMRDKGINELFQAIQMIRMENNRVVLDVVGACEEDYSAQIKAAESAGWLHYHGRQQNVHQFYRECHCCVMPSYHEGMSNVLLEASSTGRPVIATRVPGCQETFDEGVTGFGCEAKSAKSLAEAIQRFLNTSQEQRAKMGIAARKKMEREFDRNIVINAYLEEINCILTKKGE